ncbi:MAG: hypothetical protein V7695_02790 [Sulfitobacter sp.]
MLDQSSSMYWGHFTEACVLIMPNILYLDTTPDIEGPPIVIREIAKHYGYVVDYHRYFDRQTFESHVKNSARPFEILYFASHGDPNGVQCNNEHQDAIRDFSWPELGELFCQAEGLNANSTILLASCDAGFRRGAIILMANCDKINAVAGLPCKMEVQNEAIIFHTFLRHLCSNSSSEQLEQAVSLASGQQFKMFKRFDMDAEIEILAHLRPDICFTKPPEDAEETSETQGVEEPDENGH